MSRPTDSDQSSDPAADAASASEPRRPRGTGRRLHGAIAHKIGVSILSGDYTPGYKLSGEIQFSERLDVSRNAYREAMQVLTAKGLVESRPKTGTRVLPRERWNLLDPDVLAWAFEGNPDLQLIRSLFELRAIIEPAAAQFAAERRDKDDISRMKAALSAMRRHTLATDEGRAADRDFHRAILRATRNDVLVTLSAGIGAAVNWTTKFKQRARALPRNPIPDHVKVFDAIAAGDGAGARAAMLILVNFAHDDTRQSLET